ncbi:MAG: HAD-IIB family hydrolase [Candidatus Hodarchaeota archaeon]
MTNNNLNSPGFLFDIDGCLTLPTKDDLTIGVLDIKLIDKIYELHHRQVPIAFVTGRSVGYLKKQYERYNRLKYQEIPAYIEFGLVRWINGEIKVLKPAKHFTDLSKTLIDALAQYCVKYNIYFEPDMKYDDYPEHGWMWIENKLIQLSIAAGKNITPSRLHEITLSAWKDFSSLARFLPHRFGINVIPLGWSKTKATEHFVSTLGCDESNYQWFVLGDDESDREISKGLTYVNFVNTQKKASKEVWALLKALKIL